MILAIFIFGGLGFIYVLSRFFCCYCAYCGARLPKESVNGFCDERCMFNHEEWK